MWSSPVDLFYGQCVCKEGGGKEMCEAVLLICFMVSVFVRRVGGQEMCEAVLLICFMVSVFVSL